MRLGPDFIRQHLKLFVREPPVNGEPELLPDRLDAETRAMACFGIGGCEQVIQPQRLVVTREMLEIIHVGLNA